MNLVIYSLCRESDLNPDEQPLKVEWSNDVPEIGNAVSMGSERPWFVVEIAPYRSSTSTVYLVHIHPRLANPPRREWTYSGRENETIHVELSAVGEPILGFAFNVLGEAPNVGSRLMDYQRTSHPTLVQENPNDWVIDHYDECLPESEAPYRAIYLAWCRQEMLVDA
jgi:hypothetical protein